ncbi:MAG: aspartyl-tRNA(Asn)/glutamyl-tRNA(Gln) amidotransferase subunit [Baekduia sp.]|nr:aspartyl-tRNA(Asn)/glutamyl-tRNA(Gln) amidotransferase subunit [Baekduia sp.]
MTCAQDSSLRAQAQAIKAGALTPADLLEQTVRRIAELDGAYNAVCGVFDGDLDHELDSVDVGPLFGVPVGVKDMFSLPWRAPTDGMAQAAPQPGKGYSDLGWRLRAGGALGLIATNMHQLGIGTTGHVSAHAPTRNPWDPERCAGGSSGGSAAAVALRMVAGAVGTDAGGSIRIPASYCGIVGLKPTWGAVPVRGYTGAYSTMGAIGPMARDSDDCRLLGEVLLGRSLTPGAGRSGRLVIGVPVASHWDDVDHAVLVRCRAALEVLAADGAELREIQLPASEHLALATMVATGTERLPQLDRAWCDEVFPLLDVSVRAIIKSRFSLSANLVQRVLRYRTLLRRDLRAQFAEVDVIAMPSAPTPPPVVARPRVELPSGPVAADVANLHYAGLANLTGVPAISLPCGSDGDGLPVGIGLHAPWGDEALLLDVGARFERLTDRAFVDHHPVPHNQREECH